VVVVAVDVVVEVVPLTVPVVPDEVELAAPVALVVVVVPVLGTAVVVPPVEVPTVPAPVALTVAVVVVVVLPPPLVVVVPAHTEMPVLPVVQPVDGDVVPVLAVLVEPDPEPLPVPLPVPVAPAPRFTPAAAAASGESAVEERTAVVRFMMSSEITTGSLASTFMSADAGALDSADRIQSPNAEISRLRWVIVSPFQLTTVSAFSMITTSSVASFLSRSPDAVAR
jgi:hypothetical protein